MIKIIMTLLFPVFVFAQPKIKTSFTLSGQVIGRDTGFIYLYYPGIHGFVQDSCLLKQGRFLFYGDVQEPRQVIFSTFNFVANDRSRYQEKNISDFYLEPGDIRLSATINNFLDLTVEGSRSDSDRVKLLQMKEPVETKIRPIMRDYDNIFPVYKNEYQKHGKSAELKVLQERLDSISRLLDPYYKEEAQMDSLFIINNPASYVAANMLYSNIRGGATKEFPDIKKVYDRMPPHIRESSVGKDINAVMVSESNMYLGKDAVNFIILNNKGDTIDLGKLKGKYVLLDFWASWCGPCREITPILRTVYSKYKDKLEIISIASNDKESDWLNALKKDSMNWTQILDNGQLNRMMPVNNTIMDAYYINVIPSLILIDRTSRIVKLFGNSGNKQRLPIESLDEELRKVLMN